VRRERSTWQVTAVSTHMVAHCRSRDDRGIMSTTNEENNARAQAGAHQHDGIDRGDVHAVETSNDRARWRGLSGAPARRILDVERSRDGDECTRRSGVL
jgi:hypothetical protein